MKEMKLSDKDFEFLSVTGKEHPPLRFAVQSRGGMCKHECFQSIDDAMQYVFQCMREDVLFINYVEIFDMRSGLVLTFDNLKWFYRHLNGLEC